MSYEDDVVAWAEQFKERWLKATDEAVLSPGYRTLYSMNAQEANMSEDTKKKAVGALIDKLVSSVCDMIDDGITPSKIEAALYYEGMEIRIVVTLGGPNGPEENSPKED